VRWSVAALKLIVGAPRPCEENVGRTDCVQRERAKEAQRAGELNRERFDMEGKRATGRWSEMGASGKDEVALPGGLDQIGRAKPATLASRGTFLAP